MILSLRESIYTFFDYRKFLEVVLCELTLEKSMREIQEEMGLAGSAFFRRILDGVRPLSLVNAEKIIAYLQMDESESNYFRTLVQFGNERNFHKREELLRELLSLRTANVAYALQDSKLKFFSKWYYPVLRDLLPLLQGDERDSEIGNYFTPPLKGSQIASAKKFLLENDFVRLLDSGKFEATDALIETPPRVQSTILQAYHKKNLEINAKNYEALTAENRSVTSVTCTLSQESFEIVREEIRALREKILTLAANETHPDRVCHVGFNLMLRAKVKNKEKK